MLSRNQHSTLTMMIEIMLDMMMMKLKLQAGVEEMTGANKSNLSHSLIYILPLIQKLWQTSWKHGVIISRSKALTNKIKTLIYIVNFSSSNSRALTNKMKTTWIYIYFLTEILWQTRCISVFSFMVCSACRALMYGCPW